MCSVPRGRPPKPREQRIAEGNPGRRALPEPMVGLGKRLDFPAPVDLTNLGRKIWHELVPQIATLGWVDGIDETMLRLLVDTLEVIERAKLSITTDGFMLVERKYDKDGIETGETLKVNPAVRAQLQATAQAHRIAAGFGMTPSDRSRLGLRALKGKALAEDLADHLAYEDDGADDVIEVDISPERG